MKLFHLLLLLICLTPLLFSAEPKKDPGELIDILSGKEKIVLPAPIPIKERFRKDSELLKNWWNREADALKWLAVGSIGILGGVGIGMLFLRRIRKKWMSRPALKWREELFIVLAEPVLILIGAAGIFLFLIPILRSIPELYSCNVRFFATLIVLCLAWGGMEMISVFSRRMYIYAQRNDNNLDALMVDIARRLLRIVLVIIALFFIVQNVFDLNVVPLLTGAGVAGLAVAFASKETLSNFFGTIVIIADKPFRCGDFIRLDGVSGIVLEVGMRSTRLLTGDDSIVLIPNSRIESANVENISLHGVMRYIFTLGLVYGSTGEDLQKAIAILHEIVDDFHGKDAERYRPRILFDSLGASSLNIKVIMWLKTSSFRQEEEWHTELNLAIVKRFSEANLNMAFNTVTNCLTGDPAHPLVIESLQFSGKEKIFEKKQ